MTDTLSSISSQQSTDHDLLVELRTSLSGFISEMRQTGVDNRKLVADHEARIRLLEATNERQAGSINALRWFIGILGVSAAILEPLITWYVGVHR